MLVILMAVMPPPTPHFLLVSILQIGLASVHCFVMFKNSSYLKLPDSVKLMKDDIQLPPHHQGLGGKSAGLDSPKLWPGGVVNYIFKENEIDQHHRELIKAALKYIERHTCVRFRETTEHGPYLRIRNIGQGCASMIGYHSETKFVDLFLSGDICYTAGSIQHEFLHALGFWHEHNRPDRDSFVTVNWSNIIPGAKINFLKRNGTRLVTDLLPYDYQSVMHYRPDAFHRKDSLLTLVPHQSGATRLMGQRHHLSKLDADKLNLLYNCPGRSISQLNVSVMCLDIIRTIRRKLRLMTRDWLEKISENLSRMIDISLIKKCLNRNKSSR